jgi:hypothetical protein
MDTVIPKAQLQIADAGAAQANAAQIALFCV